MRVRLIVNKIIAMLQAKKYLHDVKKKELSIEDYEIKSDGIWVDFVIEGEEKAERELIQYDAFFFEAQKAGNIDDYSLDKVYVYFQDIIEPDQYHTKEMSFDDYFDGLDFDLMEKFMIEAMKTTATLGLREMYKHRWSTKES